MRNKHFQSASRCVSLVVGAIFWLGSTQAQAAVSSTASLQGISVQLQSLGQAGGAAPSLTLMDAGSAYASWAMSFVPESGPTSTGGGGAIGDIDSAPVSVAMSLHGAQSSVLIDADHGMVATGSVSSPTNGFVQASYNAYGARPLTASFSLSPFTSVTFSAYASLSTSFTSPPGGVAPEADYAAAYASLFVDGSGPLGTGYQGDGDDIGLMTDLPGQGSSARWLQVTFTNNSASVLSGSLFADVSAYGLASLPLSPVPEPGVTWMVILGLAVVLIIRRSARRPSIAAWGFMATALVAGPSHAVGRMNCAAVTEATCEVAHALTRGVNFGNMLEASPTEGSWGVSVRPEYIDIAGAAFKTVRLPVRWSNHAAPTIDGTLDEAFASRVDEVVNGLLAKDIFVILDFHHHLQISNAPLHAGEFAVDMSIIDARFINIWRQVATRYRNHSPKLLFDILNEPHFRLSGARWNMLAARALSAIRVSNPSRTVIVGVANFGRNDAYDVMVMPQDRNLILATNTYQPVSFTHQWTPGSVTCCNDAQRAEITTELDKMAAWNARTGYPIHLSEFGSIDRAPLESREIYTRFVRDEAEARGFGWTYWEFAAGFGVHPATLNTWLEPIRRALLD